MGTFTCEKCKEELNYADRIQKLDLAGYTRTYCKACAEKLPKGPEPSGKDQ